jgi:hypothetical protein
MSKLIHIYKIVNVDTNEVVYVGQTKNDILKRFKEHQKDESHPEKVQYLKNHNCTIRCLESVCVEYARSTEQFYIDEFLPVLNRNRAEENRYEMQKKALATCKEIIKNLNKKSKVTV